MADRNPYDAHLCAQDPGAFAAGFRLAARYAGCYPETAELARQMIADSSGVAWEETAARLSWPPSARRQGLALGLYGWLALADTADISQSGR
jgi:hypothetical protein